MLQQSALKHWPKQFLCGLRVICHQSLSHAATVVSAPSPPPPWLNIHDFMFWRVHKEAGHFPGLVMSFPPRRPSHLHPSLYFLLFLCSITLLWDMNTSPGMCVLPDITMLFIKEEGSGEEESGMFRSLEQLRGQRKKERTLCGCLSDRIWSNSMALAFGEIASFNGHYEKHPQTWGRTWLSSWGCSRGERFRKGRDSQGLFEKFLISLIVAR